jgi:hypothetical protein
MFDMVVYSSDNENDEAAVTTNQPLSALKLARRRRHRLLGKFGVAAEKMTIRRNTLRKQNYSVSLISAIT